MRDHAAPPPIRDAATVVVLREGVAGASVLMGRRGARAAFMPSKYVFPGGAVDPGDGATAFAAPLTDATRAALAVRSAATPEALAAAGLRELAEETGQVIGRPGPDGPAWPGFEGLVPDASALRFVFRAITPPDRPRRFDARFFLADAAALATDPDALSPPDAELSDLAWVPLSGARRLDMPFVTAIVLAEVAAIRAGRRADGVPILDNSGPGTEVYRV